MHIDEAADGPIIRQAAAGNPSAFEHLFDRHFEAVYHYALSLCGDPHCAQDLTQEAFIRAYHNLDKFQEPWNFRAWLVRVSRNLYLNEDRQAARMNPLTPSHPLPAAGPTPEGLVVQGEQSNRVMQTILSLVPNYREALILREVDGLSYHDIAGIMNTSLDNVKVLIHRARASFKEHYSLRLLTEDDIQSCTVLNELLDAWHDGQPLGGLEKKVRSHVESCAACQQRRRELAAIAKLLTVLPVLYPAPRNLRYNVIAQTAAQAPQKKSASKEASLVGALAIATIIAGWYFGNGGWSFQGGSFESQMGKPTATEDAFTSPPAQSTLPAAAQPSCQCGDAICNPACENSDLCALDCQCTDDGVCAPGEGFGCFDCGAAPPPASCSCTSVCVAEALDPFGVMRCTEWQNRDCNGNSC